MKHIAQPRWFLIMGMTDSYDYLTGNNHVLEDDEESEDNLLYEYWDL